MRRRINAMLVLILAVGLMGAAADGCEEPTEPEFVSAATNQGVVGVVERRTLASNPLPWGTSISVATRIWGGITAERWKVSDRRFTECPPYPAAAVGSIEYDFRGSEADWGGQRNGVTRDEELTGAEKLVLDIEFGEAQSFPVSDVDRTMAVIRLWGLELTIGVVAFTFGVVALFRRRRARRYDRHLF